jgi:hypothetical protein
VPSRAIPLLSLRAFEACKKSEKFIIKTEIMIMLLLLLLMMMMMMMMMTEMMTNRKL